MGRRQVNVSGAGDATSQDCRRKTVELPLGILARVTVVLEARQSRMKSIAAIATNVFWRTIWSNPSAIPKSLSSQGKYLSAGTD